MTIQTLEPNTLDSISVKYSELDLDTNDRVSVVNSRVGVSRLDLDPRTDS